MRSFDHLADTVALWKVVRDDDEHQAVPVTYAPVEEEVVSAPGPMSYEEAWGESVRLNRMEEVMES